MAGQVQIDVSLRKTWRGRLAWELFLAMHRLRLRWPDWLVTLWLTWWLDHGWQIRVGNGPWKQASLRR